MPPPEKMMIIAINYSLPEVLEIDLTTWSHALRNIAFFSLLDKTDVNLSFARFEIVIFMSYIPTI